MLEEALIAYGSPTLARLKLGSLFGVPRARAELAPEIVRLNGILVPRGVRLTAVRSAAERTLLYLYREQMLAQVLSQPNVQAFLSAYGYGDFSVGAALRILRARLAAAREFPHEIGIFLGYPLEDVIGFIGHGGRDCLCAGCWKVYANAHEAQRAFARLHKCGNVYGRMFAKGYSLSRLTVRSAPTTER